MHSAVGMLWYSGPTSLNWDLEKYKAVDMDINRGPSLCLSGEDIHQGHPAWGAQRLTMENSMQEWVERPE